MTQRTWIGDEEELATEQDQIPPQGLTVGYCYEVLPLSAYSPSDFSVRLRDRQSQNLSLMGELREVYAAKPSWLRLQGADISRYIPVAYVSDDDWIGRGYLAVEMADDHCVVHDPDDGSFDFIKIANLFRLGVDHASIPAFSSKFAVAGVRPKDTTMWSPEVCLAFKERVMTSSIFVQVELAREGTILGQARCNQDGFFYAWLAFNNHARLSSQRGRLYPYLEEEFNILQ